MPRIDRLRDADFLGRGDNAPERLVRLFRELCELEVEPDGLVFDADSVQAERITENADYEGVRVTFTARLDRARIPIQIDIGFGDAVTPAPVESDYPTLLPAPRPRLLVYPKETVVAEKFEAIVKLGIANTRMKDFYDLEVLARTFEFEGELLAKAIRTTFANRATEWPTTVDGVLQQDSDLHKCYRPQERRRSVEAFPFPRCGSSPGGNVVRDKMETRRPVAVTVSLGQSAFVSGIDRSSATPCESNDVRRTADNLASNSSSRP